MMIRKKRNRLNVNHRSSSRFGIGYKFLVKKLYRFSIKHSLFLDYWFYIVIVLLGGGSALYLFFQNLVNIPVPVHDLPAYSQIQTNDLTHKVYPRRRLTSDMVRDSRQLVGRHTLIRVSKHQPVKKEQIIDSSGLANTVAVGISATSSMALGGNLQAGDVVDIIFVPTSNTAKSSPKPVLFPNILILSLKSQNIKADASLSEPGFAIVIALPSDHRQEFAQLSSTSKMMITRKLSAP